MNDSNLCARNRCDVRKLHRNVSAAYKDDARRKRIQFEELIAAGNEILSRNAQWCRLHSRCDHDMPSFEEIIACPKRCRSRELGCPMENRDTGFAKTVFFGLRHGLSERAFELHQFRPVDSRQLVAETLSH